MKRQFLFCFFTAFAVLALRNPDWWVHPQFFAEDGTIFFSQQAARGAKAFYEPYVGYIHLVPRLVAWIAWPFPARVQPAMYQFLGIAVASVTAAFFVLPEFRFIIASDGMRATVSLLAITDCYGRQIFGTINSCQVFLVPLALLLLWSDRRGLWRVVVVGLSTLTAPGLILFLPVAIWKWLRGRSPVALAFVSGALIQGLVVFTHPDRSPHPPWPVWVPFLATFESWIYRVLLETIVGRENTMWLGLRGGVWLTVGIFFVVAGACVYIVRKFPQRSAYRSQFSLCFALGYLLVLQMFLLRPGMLNPILPTDHFLLFGGTRYFLFSVWLFMVAVAIAVEWLARHWSPARRCGLVLLLFAFGTFENYRIEPYQDLHWNAQAPRVEQWRIDRKGLIEIPINPSPWAVYLP